MTEAPASIAGARLVKIPSRWNTKTTCVRYRFPLRPASVPLAMSKKVVYLIRHGQAVHNVAAAVAGMDAYRSWEYEDAKSVCGGPFPCSA